MKEIPEYNTSRGGRLHLPIRADEKFQNVKPPVQYADMVRSLCKSGILIKDAMTPNDAHMLHMAVGISGEAGELLNAIKKAVIYREPLDLINVKEELGDLEFYMEGLRQATGMTREECLEMNIAKLSTRYRAFKYTDVAAIDRVDKKVGEL